MKKAIAILCGISAIPTGFAIGYAANSFATVGHVSLCLIALAVVLAWDEFA